MGSRSKLAVALALGLLGIAALLYGLRLPLPAGDALRIEPPSGTYRHDLRITLRPAHPGAPILLAWDGLPPDEEVGWLYDSPLRLEANPPRLAILQARERGSESVQQATYLLGPPLPLPALVIAADPAQLWGDNGLLLGGTTREITVHLTLLEGEGPASWSAAGGLRLEAPWAEKPTFRLAFRQRYGAGEAALTWADSSTTSAKRLLLEGGGTEGRAALFEAQLIARQAERLGLPTATCRPVLLFLDTEPWGLYLLRERVDRFYLRDHFGIKAGDLLFGSDAHEGDKQAWEAMIAALTALDAEGTDFYEVAAQWLDLPGLADAVLLTQAMGGGEIAAVRERREGAPWQWIVNPMGRMEADDPVLQLHRRLLENGRYRAMVERQAAALFHGSLAPATVEAERAALATAWAEGIRDDLLRWPPPPAVEYDDPFTAWDANLRAHTAALEAHLTEMAEAYPLPPTAASPAAATEAPRPNDVVINEYWLADDGTPYASLEGRGIVGDWIELRTRRPHLDLRGWRLTDNDRKTSTEEGSLFFPDLPALADLPQGTVILIIATENITNSRTFPADDLSPADGRLLFYVGNGHLDRDRDPGFALDRHDEALVLLAPGPTEALEDDIGVDFVAEGSAVTPQSFGVAEEGVRFTGPFRGLGRDDGAIFTGEGSNDDGRIDWIVDPPPQLSGDTEGAAANILTPGMPNERQSPPAVQRRTALLTTGLLAAALLVLLLSDRRRGRRSAGRGAASAPGGHTAPDSGAGRGGRSASAR